VDQPERWAKVRRKLELEGDSLTRPPRGYDPDHPFIEDIKRKDFVASITFTDRQVCDTAFMRDFAALLKLNRDETGNAGPYVRKLVPAFLHPPDFARSEA
jgi:uncharacterized protein (DUF2461 family)